MDQPIDFALTEVKTPVQFWEIRRQATLLPNEPLRHMRMIGQMVEQFSRGQPSIGDTHY
jgi:hypothetical protein